MEKLPENASQGAQAIFRWLTEKGVNFEVEFPVNFQGQELRYDFYVKEWNLFIEYDGEQHFKLVPHFHRTPSKFIEQYQRDQVKNAYALRVGIHLLRIPFWQETAIETILDKTLIVLPNLFGTLSVSDKYYTSEFEEKNVPDVIEKTVPVSVPIAEEDQEFLKLIKPFETAPKTPSEFIIWFIKEFEGGPARYVNFVKDLPFLSRFGVLELETPFKKSRFRFKRKEITYDELIKLFIDEIYKFLNSLIERSSGQDKKTLEKIKKDVNVAKTKQIIDFLDAIVKRKDIWGWKKNEMMKKSEMIKIKKSWKEKYNKEYEKFIEIKNKKDIDDLLTHDKKLLLDYCCLFQVTMYDLFRKEYDENLFSYTQKALIDSLKKSVLIGYTYNDMYSYEFKLLYDKKHHITRSIFPLPSDEISKSFQKAYSQKKEEILEKINTELKLWETRKIHYSYFTNMRWKFEYRLGVKKIGRDIDFVVNFKEFGKIYIIINDGQIDLMQIKPTLSSEIVIVVDGHKHHIVSDRQDMRFFESDLSFHLNANYHSHCEGCNMYMNYTGGTCLDCGDGRIISGCEEDALYVVKIKESPIVERLHREIEELENLFQSIVDEPK